MKKDKEKRLIALTRWAREAKSLEEQELLFKLILFYQDKEKAGKSKDSSEWFSKEQTEAIRGIVRDEIKKSVRRTRTYRRIDKPNRDLF